MNWWASRKQQPSAGQAAKAGGLSAQGVALWQSAFKLHQSGQIADAARSYRKLLALHPDHFDSCHLLGVTCLQEGRLDEAREHIARAIGLDPAQAAAHSNLGTTLLRLGQFASACASLQTALQLNPKDANSMATLGTALLGQGDAAGAANQFRRALANGAAPSLRNELGAALLESGDAAGAVREFQALLRQHPADAGAHGNLALALERSGNDKRALQEYERALALDAGQNNARINRATLLAHLGRTEEARRDYEEAIRRQPKSAAAHANMGGLLRDGGDPAAALPFLHRALEIEPRLFEARLNLAQVNLELGDVTGAAALAQSLAKDYPRSADAHAMQALALLAAGRPDDAEAAAQHALALDAGLARAHQVQGLARMARGDATGARESHAEAARRDPLDAAARWAGAMAQLSAIFDAPPQIPASRDAFAQALEALDRWFDAPRAVQGGIVVGSTQPFYLAYQPGNHRDLLARYGSLCARLVKPWAANASPPVVSSGPRPLRVGFVSAHVQDHSVWNAIVRGWVEQLDRTRFEVVIFSLGAVLDDQSRLAQQLAQKWVPGPASARDWSARIAAAGIDVLIYTEIGMDATTVKLASMRLAPVQLAAWGHPLTSGLPTMDGYLSAAAFEPPGAKDHYTEELVALPGLGVCYPALDVEPQAIDRAKLGLPPEAPLLLCAGLPFKYLPQDDDVWVDIAQRVPHARLVFFKASTAFMHTALERRLRARFTEQGMDFDRHVSFIRLLSRPEFFGLMRQAHVFLDTIGFSGFNTAMQAVQCELPIVAFEGDALRGRFASGILRELGLDEWVASSRQEYVDRAVALAMGEGERAAAAGHMRRHGPRLFGTPEPVRALEVFLESRAGRS